MNPWEQIKHQLQAALSPESYQNCVSHTSPEQLDGGVLGGLVPDAESEARRENHDASHVGAIIGRLNGPGHAVLYQPVKATPVSATAESDRSWEAGAAASQLR